MQEITDTLHALVRAMSVVHQGTQAEAYEIARAIVAAVCDGKVPLLKLDDDA